MVLNRLRATAGALMFVVALGCNPAAPDPPAEPEVPRRLLRLGSIRAHLPDAWEAVPSRALARLSAAARQNDPEGRMEMVAVGMDGTSPDFSLTLIDLSPARSEGRSARDTVEAMQRDLETASAARGLTVTFEHTCDARHCDANYTVEGSGPRQQNRVRVWRRGDQIHQRRCACVDTACREMERCELPEPPRNAATVDATQ